MLLNNINCCSLQVSFTGDVYFQNESIMVMWAQWRGEYKLRGLDKDSSYLVEICQYGNEGSTNKCDETEVITY